MAESTISSGESGDRTQCLIFINRTKMKIKEFLINWILSPILWILVFVWTLPQTLLGMYLVKGFHAEKYIQKGFTHFMTSPRMRGGISLGMIVLIQCINEAGSYVRLDIMRHEYGHVIQSLILGPLYLIVIGLPSLLWAAFICDWTDKDYYWFYTERWANKLGDKYFKW